MSELDNVKLEFSLYLNLILPKGKIVYEYNALRNFRIVKDMYEYKNLYYSYESIKEIYLDNIGSTLPNDIDEWPDETKLNFNNWLLTSTTKLEPGAIIDLDTELLGFNLNYPVSIECQPSYDGSVNLILNDGKNSPKLINTRFSCKELNTYEVVDRIGNNDTNIYDLGLLFELDTSLYKRISTIPKLTFQGVFSGGNLPVGNYVLYIKYSDADGNETDFVAESGIISCFVGNYVNPESVHGGYRDMDSNKYLSITISDIDLSYDYVKIYYTRSTSDVNLNKVILAYKIDKKYPVLNQMCKINITGKESTTSISIDEINSLYFIAQSCKALTQCLNRLFLGNVQKPILDYQDLSDCALRILPYVTLSDHNSLIGDVSENGSNTASGIYDYMYYNPMNIYHHVGYYNHEIYRFGVVFIMSDGSLSPVFNIRGRNNIPEEIKPDDYSEFPFKENGYRKFIETVDLDSYEINKKNLGNYENSKGVVKISNSPLYDFPIYSIGFAIPEEVLNYLQTNLNIAGLFFVRQKRIPLIIAQSYIIPRDILSLLPCLLLDDGVYIESFINQDRILTNDKQSRLYKLSENLYNGIRDGLCPEYITNLAHLNNLFQGSKFYLVLADTLPSSNSFGISNYDGNIYAPRSYTTNNNSEVVETEVVGIPDNTAAIAIKDYVYRARAGEAEEAYKFQYIGDINKTKDAYNLVRGSYCSYLGFGSSLLLLGRIYNIYSNEYTSSTLDQFKTRYLDESAYYAISDRISLSNIRYEYNNEVMSLRSGASSEDDASKKSDSLYYTTECFRGDCFISNFTIRFNRNFLDPSAPTNDEIIDERTWADNYDPSKKEDFDKINRGDVNAIKLGSWFSFKVLSPNNLSLRSLDYSYPDEEGLTGHYRGFYPYYGASTEGSYKIPESGVINDGYSTTVSERYNFIQPDVPYIKNTYQTRIAYSDKAINDAFVNGYRTFNLTSYRDYSTVYGGIMKLVELLGSILCIFEHGIAVIPVNERTVAGSGAGGNVFINTNNVLPENPNMLSDMYGTLWPESVIKTPYYVYGVDTVGKKVWRTNGLKLEIISDFKVQLFLNENITLTERELTPVIGIRNVKSHYNAFKSDVMFTFYDNLYGTVEKSWNLCWNEILNKWVTFYSWIPSYSENIDNIFFSFDRNTSKYISKLALSTKNSSSAEGVVLSETRIDKWKKIWLSDLTTLYGTELGLVNRPIPETDGTLIDLTYAYSIIHSSKYKNYFKICTKGEESYLCIDTDKEAPLEGKTLEECIQIILKDLFKNSPVIYIEIECDVGIILKSGTNEDRKLFVSGWTEYIRQNAGYYTSNVAITTDEILTNPAVEVDDLGNIIGRPINLTTNFWKHGQSGIIDIKDQLKPTFWYGKLHPFEFEFIVLDDPSVHKIFNNLKIISNSAEPESFHYEIVGDSYNFSNDKLNMYYRLEASRETYLNLGSDITYDTDYTKMQGSLKRLNKSTIFPSYYTRKDTINEIEDSYIDMRSDSRNYINLSGSEIVHDKTLNEFRIATHIAGTDLHALGGRLRGNMLYKEDHWYVQIPSINISLKNENEASWRTPNPGLVAPPLVLNWIPDDVKKELLTLSDLPNTYDIGQVEVGGWTFRQEAKIRDKYVKIKIRYKGDKLAVITQIKTLFNISYS